MLSDNEPARLAIDKNGSSKIRESYTHKIIIS
jgi:hypothetical protein